MSEENEANFNNAMPDGDELTESVGELLEPDTLKKLEDGEQLTPKDVDALQNITAWLGDFFQGGKLTDGDANKLVDGVKDTLGNVYQQINPDNLTLPEILEKLNKSLNKFANDAVANWNKAIAEEKIDEVKDKVEDAVKQETIDTTDGNA